MATEIPVHTHEVLDDDASLHINPETMEVESYGYDIVIPQHSKNSERISFSLLDRVIEGHDMSTCNKVEIHFCNIGASKTNPGIYEVNDFKVNEESNFVSFSWLINNDATQLVGALIFSVHFMCIENEVEIVYDLPTLTFSRISVGATVWNADVIAEKYPDILRDLERRINEVEPKVANHEERLSVIEEEADAINDRLNTFEPQITALSTRLDVAEPKVNKVETDLAQIGQRVDLLEADNANVLVSIDFSNIDNGSFTETLKDGTVIPYNVTYDENGNPSMVGGVTVKW